ncbi:MAG: CRISPR-associated protein Cas4 [Fusobacteriia bacterium 4572_132]|nr:MAG: CRISPR-associated protein Cas4 [Fusobacteriia bacterium 4572_132]
MPSITPSLVLEYLYCPRFIYFMKVLQIKQNEESRFKVMKGREIHKYKSITNKEYKRKKINVIKKEIEQELYSDKYNIHGKVDEILFLEDGKAVPLDYKFAKYENRIYKGYKTQLIMYGLMINDIYGIDVKRGYLVYTRSENKLIEIIFTKKDFEKIKIIIDEILEIIITGKYPKSTKSKSRCNDCCYRNICIK